MRTKFFIWATVVIAAMTVNGLSTRALALEGLSFSDSLFYRGIVCLAFVLGMSQRLKISLRPKAPRTQIFRALIAGFALSLFTLSYNWLTASTVAVLSNIDVPLIIILGPAVGVIASRSTRVLASVSILFLVWYVTSLEAQPNMGFGLATLAGGSVSLCFGYSFIKKSMAEENEAVTILTPSLAIIFYGLGQNLIFHPESISIDPSVSFLLLLSGMTMFILYFATMRLYDLTDLASAEFPTLIASILIQPFEMVFLGAPMNSQFVGSSIGFVVMTYFVLLFHYRTRPAELVVSG